MDSIVLAIVTASITALFSATINKFFNKMDERNNPDGQSTTEQLEMANRRKKLVFMFYNFIFSVVILAGGYMIFKAKHFPTAEGCVTSNDVQVYDQPWTGPGTHLPNGSCYSFDAKYNTPQSEWIRLTDDNNREINGKWVQAMQIQLRLCEINPLGRKQDFCWIP